MEVPEWKKTAQAMKQAADENGVDFMTSPIGDIVAALQRAVEIVETPPDPSKGSSMNKGTLVIGDERFQIVGLYLNQGALWVVASTASARHKSPAINEARLMEVYGEDGALVNRTVGHVAVPRYRAGDPVKFTVRMYWKIKDDETVLADVTELNSPDPSKGAA